MASCAVCRVKTGAGDGARCKKRELCLWLRCYLDFCNNDPFNVNKPPDKPLLPSTVKKSDCQDKAGGARMNATARQRMLLWGSSEFILWSGHVTRIALSRMFPPDHPSVCWLHSDFRWTEIWSLKVLFNQKLSNSRRRSVESLVMTTWSRSLLIRRRVQFTINSALNTGSRHSAQIWPNLKQLKMLHSKHYEIYVLLWSALAIFNIYAPYDNNAVFVTD